MAQEVDPESLARHRAALLQWGDEWQARDWHGEVPRCLTDEYAHTVVRAGDRERLIALLTSRERVAMLRQRTGSDRRALEDIRRGLEVLTRPMADGLEPAVRAALAVDAMRRGDDDPPLGLILAYAHVGSWSQAEHLAHLAEELSGVTALASVAETAVSSGQSARCWPLAATALERLEGIDWVDLEAERKHPMAFRPHDRHEDDVPLKHIIRAGLLGRLSVLAEDVHRFAASRALSARIWVHVAQIAEIDREAFEYLSWAALAGARAGDREDTGLLLARLKGNSQVADARSLVRAARAAEIVGQPQVHADFVRALPQPKTLTSMIDIAEEFLAHGDLTMARHLLRRHGSRISLADQGNPGVAGEPGAFVEPS